MHTIRSLMLFAFLSSLRDRASLQFELIALRHRLLVHKHKRTTQSRLNQAVSSAIEAGIANRWGPGPAYLGFDGLRQEHLQLRPFSGSLVGNGRKLGWSGLGQRHDCNAVSAQCLSSRLSSLELDSVAP